MDDILQRALQEMKTPTKIYTVVILGFEGISQDQLQMADVVLAPAPNTDGWFYVVKARRSENGGMIPPSIMEHMFGVG